MIIGSAVTSLNDEGFRFKIHTPEIHEAEQGYKGSEDTEALVMCFETPAGSVFMNIAMRYNRRRKADSAAS
jgi:CheY-specific phosphatase CheX